MSFGPGVIYIGTVGTTPLSDIGAVNEGMTLAHEIEPLEVIQGSPDKVIREFRDEEDVALSFQALQWYLSNLDQYLGAGTVSGDEFGFGGDIDFVEASLRLVHQMPPLSGATVGSTITIDVWRARSDGDLEIDFSEGIHDFPLDFIALPASQDWAGNALAQGEEKYRIALDQAPVPIEPPNDWLQLREHRDAHCGSCDLTVSFEYDTTHLYVDSDLNQSKGWGHVFIVVQRAYLNGKKVQVDWRSPTGSNYKTTRMRILDGSYARATASDFPDGSDMPSKGNGVLTTPFDHTGNFSQVTETTGVLDLTGGSEGDVTVFLSQGMSAAYDTWLDLYIYSFKILDSDDSELIEFVLDPVTMEVTGTYGDYGYTGSGS